jgi:hypothetical protein
VTGPERHPRQTSGALVHMQQPPGSGTVIVNDPDVVTPGQPARDCEAGMVCSNNEYVISAPAILCGFACARQSRYIHDRVRTSPVLWDQIPQLLQQRSAVQTQTEM